MKVLAEGNTVRFVLEMKVKQSTQRSHETRDLPCNLNIQTLFYLHGV